MIEVGVRELKAHLSYYLRLMQDGEEIAIRMRNTVVGYLSRLQHVRRREAGGRRSTRQVRQLIAAWKKEGFVLSGGGAYRPCKPVKMTPGPTSTEIIRAMRDEGW